MFENLQKALEGIGMYNIVFKGGKCLANFEHGGKECHVAFEIFPWFDDSEEKVALYVADVKKFVEEYKPYAME